MVMGCFEVMWCFVVLLVGVVCVLVQVVLGSVAVGVLYVTVLGSCVVSWLVLVCPGVGW